MTIDEMKVMNNLTELRENSSLIIEEGVYYVRTMGELGIAIECDDSILIEETAMRVSLKSVRLPIQEENKNYIFLSTSKNNINIQFAWLCMQFFERGENDKNRDIIVHNPIQWWVEWTSLLGDKKGTKTCFDVLGELCVYKHLIEQGVKPTWYGPDYETNDLDSKEGYYEVKSTTTKDSYHVTISSRIQLEKKDKPLWLYLCRFEKNNQGISINSIVEDLARLGENKDEINSKLAKLGYGIRKACRNVKYKIIEKKKYLVDDDFPVIDFDALKVGKLTALVNISYTIDLVAVKSENW